MGNFCSSRADPEDSRQQYEKYTFLRQQILSKLSDEVLANECGHLYAEECRRRKVPALSKAHWEEVCFPFILRVSCNDPQTQQRIWHAVEEVYPGPPERPVNEATFIEFHRLALTLAEQDLRQRIAKLKEKWPSGPAPTGDWMSDFMGKEPEAAMEPLEISPKAAMKPPGPDAIGSQSLPLPALSDGEPSPRPCASPRLSMQSSPRASLLMGSRVTLSSCEAIGSQISYVLKDPKMEPAAPVSAPPLDSHASLRESKSELRRGRDQEQVREMREVILRGQLDVMVFNKRRQPEDRKLGLLQASRRMQILRLDGSSEDSWDIDHLQCISFGIAASILPEPPPADKTLSFRFHFQKYGSEARYLCAMFADGATCRLAAAAFSQLCGVPVTTSEHFVQN